MSDWDKHRNLQCNLAWQDVKAALNKLVAIHGADYSGQAPRQKTYAGYESTKAWVKEFVEAVEGYELHLPPGDCDVLNASWIEEPD